MKRHLGAEFLVSVLSLMSGLLGIAPLTAQDTTATAWGGQHIEITMGATGAEIAFDCATGTITEPLKVDAQGKFQAEGTYTREHPGPVMKDEKGSAPAIYSGSIAGDSMHLDIVLAKSKESVGSYVLTRGQPGRVFKCR